MASFSDSLAFAVVGAPGVGLEIVGDEIIDGVRVEVLEHALDELAHGLLVRLCAHWPII